MSLYPSDVREFATLNRMKGKIESIKQTYPPIKLFVCKHWLNTPAVSLKLELIN